MVSEESGYEHGIRICDYLYLFFDSLNVFYMYFDNFVSDYILNHVFICILIILLDCAIWPFGHET